MPSKRRKERGRARRTETSPEEENRRRPQEASQDSAGDGSNSPPPSQPQSVGNGFISPSENDSAHDEIASCAPNQGRCEEVAQSDPLEALGIELKQKLSITPAFPRRPGYGNLGRRINLISNCFPIEVPSGNVYHYDVDVAGIERNPATEEERNVDEEANDEAEDEVTGRDRSYERYRCLKTKDKRKVIEKMLERDSVFDGLYAAYDGEKNLYTREPVPATFPHIFTTDKEDEIRGRVKIKPVKKKDTTSCAIDLDLIHSYFKKRTNYLPKEAIAALETILRHGPCLRLTPIGRSFFTPPLDGSLNPLAGGLEIWFGYHQSIRISQWKPTVNIDITATTFYKAGPLLEYIAELLDTTKNELQRIPYLADRDIRKISRKLVNKKVEATHSLHRRKYTVVRLTRENAHNLHFDLEVENRRDRVTVAQYFFTHYNITLKFPNLPCVQVKPEERNIYVPVELCKLIKGQHYNQELSEAHKSEMIKFTSPAPKERFQKIRNRANFTNDRCVQEFELEVSSEPLHVEGRILDPPSLIYRDEKKIRPRDGAWNMRDAKFFHGVKIESWVLLSFVRTDEYTLRKFGEVLETIGEKLGVDINRCRYRRFINGRYNMKELLLSMKSDDNVDLILIVIPNDDVAIYRDIKKSAETMVGLITQCIRLRTVKKITDPQNRNFAQLVTNVFLKINSKMGGINYSLVLSEIPKILWVPVMVIGADVNHPGAYRGLKNSLAACAGSLDARCSLYAVRTRPQKCTDEDKKSQEIIEDLEAMVVDLLRAFYRHTGGKKPEKIIFYRDGVSEGEFKKIRNVEVKSVRKACRTLAEEYKPGITFIVVQKRHHMRFMTEDSRFRNSNIPPDTVIDTDVTHPENFDFFLSSQNCPKGTARPAHYTVIEDDNDFTANDLQKFTNQLCYTYVRCTKSISIPAPVAYAHLAAYRARQYLDADGEGSSASSDSSTGRRLPSIDEVTGCMTVEKELKNRMYFV